MGKRTKPQKLLAKAILQHKAGHLVDAERLYKQVLRKDPGIAEAWYMTGMIANQSGQVEKALKHIDRALKITPDNGHYHYNRGVILQNSDRPDDAANAYREALRHDPEHIATLENLAVALADTGAEEEGEAVCHKVLNLVPDSPVAHRNLGTLLLGKGQRKRALEHFDHLLALNPGDASARSKRYTVLLSLGRFLDGYRDYRWRHHCESFNGPSPPKLLPLPSLGEQPVDGRKIVILAEQGVGDEVLFAAGLPSVLSRVAGILLFADPRLVPLLQRSFPSLDVRPSLPSDRCKWPSGIDASWLRCEAGDLPRMAFGDDYPVPAAYLKADPKRVGFWRERLADLPGRRIGIAWHGGADARAQRARSVSLADFAPLMDSLDASFINLQYPDEGQVIATEIENFNASRVNRKKLVTMDGLDRKNDLDDLAALTLALDFVVTIDSAIAHLAAAVGANTCILLPPSADWRWFDTIDNSPWYINATVWRRAADEKWAATIQRLLEYLQNAITVPAAHNKIADTASEQIRANDNANTAAANTSGTALMLNDTSAWSHWGCSCSSIALHENLRKQYGTVNSCALTQNLPPEILPESANELSSAIVFRRFRKYCSWLIDAIEDADRVFINGDDKLQGNGLQAKLLLYLAWIAADQIGRPVHIINHSVYPLDSNTTDEGGTVAMYKQVYERVEKIVVREPVSYAVLDAIGIKSVLGFDCLPLFAEPHTAVGKEKPEPGKYIVISGSVLQNPARIALYAELVDRLHDNGYRISILLGARGFPAADDAAFAAALYSATTGKIDIVLATSESDWLRCIQSACLLISGRFHHSIAAACLKTPFVVIASNTPKITGLMQIFAALSANPAGFPVLEDNRDMLTAAIEERLAVPAEFILDDLALQSLRELAMQNFPLQ